MRDRRKNDFLTESRRRSKERETVKTVSLDNVIGKRTRAKFRDIVEGLNAVFMLEETGCQIEFVQHKMFFNFDGVSIWENYSLVISFDKGYNSLKITSNVDFESDKIKELLTKYKYYFVDQSGHVNGTYSTFMLYPKEYVYKVLKLQSILDSTILSDILCTIGEEASATVKNKLSKWWSRVNSYSVASYGYYAHLLASAMMKPRSIDIDTASWNYATKKMSEFVLREGKGAEPDIDLDIETTSAENVTEVADRILKHEMKKYGKDTSKFIYVDLESNFSL